jgi:hypothetical protein
MLCRLVESVLSAHFEASRLVCTHIGLATALFAVLYVKLSVFVCCFDGSLFLVLRSQIWLNATDVKSLNLVVSYSWFMQPITDTCKFHDQHVGATLSQGP